MDADKEFCERTYAGSLLIKQEQRIIKTLFDAYGESDEHSAKAFLAEEVRFTGPTVRRAYLEKAFAEIIAAMGGDRIPRHTSRTDRPGIATSHYSLYRVDIFGITISAVGDEKNLPRQTDYRNSLIEGLERTFEFAAEPAPADRYLYLLFQHGKGDIDAVAPRYASFKAIDRQQGLVWKRPLFKYHAKFVNDIIDATTPETQSQNDELVRLKKHIRRLEAGEAHE